MAVLRSRERQAMALTPMRGEIRTLQVGAGLADMVGATQVDIFGSTRASAHRFAVMDQTKLAQPHVPSWSVPAKIVALAFGVAVTWTPIFFAARSIVSG